MNEPLDYTATLKNQLKVLLEDQKKTQEKLFQIAGAIKVISHLLDEYQSHNAPTDVEVNSNGTH